MNNEYQKYEDQNNNQTVININSVPQKNTIGLIGFILSIVNIIASFLPYIGFVIWLLGAIFSIIGLFRAPRGFAIAGTIISFIWLIIFIIIILVLGTAAILIS